MISLLTFIKTGRLGKVGLGSTCGEVEELFGLPRSWDGRHDRKRATIWKYGANEIYFSKNIVFMIFIYDFINLQLGNAAFDTNGMTRHLDEDEAELWLLEYEIPFDKRRISWCDEGVEFRVALGVTLTLCAEIGNQCAHSSSVSLVRS